MAVFQKSFTVRTKKSYDFVEVTEEIGDIAKESKIKNGIVFANALHNTAALVIQEKDETIHHDLTKTLDRLFPQDAKYEHDYEGNANATAHLKSNFLGTFVTLPLTEGKLNLGTWQSVFFVELFEPRKRTVVVTVVGE